MTHLAPLLKSLLAKQIALPRHIGMLEIQQSAGFSTHRQAALIEAQVELQKVNDLLDSLQARLAAQGDAA
jgi:hypothetical protein